MYFVTPANPLVKHDRLNFMVIKKAHMLPFWRSYTGSRNKLCPHLGSSRYVSLKVAGMDFCAKSLKSLSLSGRAAGQHRGLFVRAGGPDRQ